MYDVISFLFKADGYVYGDFELEYIVIEGMYDFIVSIAHEPPSSDISCIGICNRA